MINFTSGVTHISDVPCISGLAKAIILHDRSIRGHAFITEPWKVGDGSDGTSGRTYHYMKVGDVSDGTSGRAYHYMNLPNY